MQLHGKKIAFLGDSITEGWGTSQPEHIFWQQLARSTGAQCHGYGIGGTRIAQQLDNENDQHYATRIDSMIPDADVVVVFGGTNDFGHGDAPLGRPEDREGDSFCAALHQLLQQLIRRYPHAQLVTMTPLHRLSEDEAGLNECGVRRCGRLVDYVDAIIEISGFYGIPVLDLYRVSGLQPRNEILRELYMPDGLHPNDAGHTRIAQKLEGFLGTL